MTARPSTPVAVLFDLDGTLADSEAPIATAIAAALADHGYARALPDVAAVLGPPLRGMVQLLVGDLDDATHESIRAAYFRHYDRLLPSVQPLPGALALLDALAATRTPLAVVTNKVEAGAYSQLNAMGLTARFAAVVGADSTAAPKPAPDPARAALARLACASAAAAAFVGDRDEDMQCAHAAGIGLRIALAGARPPASLRAAGATHVAADLYEVAALLGVTTAATRPA
jgi:phosphoglycolate phosphatase